MISQTIRTERGEKLTNGARTVNVPNLFLQHNSAFLAQDILRNVQEFNPPPITTHWLASIHVRSDLDNNLQILQTWVELKALFPHQALTEKLTPYCKP